MDYGLWTDFGGAHLYSTNTECTVVVQYSTRVEYSTIEEKFVVGGMGMGMCVHSGGGAHFSSICFNAPVPWYMLFCATMVSWSGVSEVDGTCN